MGTHTFQTLLEPALFSGVNNVHVFCTHGATVSGFEGVNNIFQRRFFLTDEERAGLKHDVQIGTGQPMKCQIQIRYFLPFHQVQRIQLGMLVTTTTVGINQLQNFNLLAFVIRGDRRLGYRTGTTLIFGEEEKLLPDGLMRGIC